VPVTDIEKLACELIALPSVNPAFLPQNHPQAGEGRVADFLAATAAQAGLDVELQEVLPGRPNVLARLTPAGVIRRRVILAPHTDTVPAFSEDQFAPRLRQGRIYGRGACDTKGSIAAMLGALTALAQSPARPAATEIIFAGVIDEENAQAGSHALAASGLKGDLAIVGEPTRLAVVTAHKGSLWLRLETRGKAAHGACPHLGRNAVHEMARIVDLLETDYARQLKRRRHPLLGCATVSVGSINGGSQPNIVPAQCQATVDRRTLPGETEASPAQTPGGRQRLQDQPVPSDGNRRHTAAGEEVHAGGRASQAGGRPLLLRCVGAGARGHPEHCVRAGRHCPGAHGRRVDRAEIPGHSRGLPAEVFPNLAVTS
jgi:acetylornithine deacetylase/succinyl-diaminopimelate desuccinylase-like protein